MAIPKIFHQTWKDENIPERWVEYRDKLLELHPDWDYCLWTDAKNEAFINKHYPRLIDRFRSYPKPVMRADVIRYAIMDQVGGVYLDLDYEFIKPFDLNESICILPLSRSTDYGDKELRIGNCIMASKPGHPFWKVVLQDLMEYTAEIGLDELDVEKATGPLLLTRIYNARKWEDIDTPERLLFHPPTPRNERQYKAILGNGISYGIHHADGSWRENKWKLKLKKLFARL